MVYMVGRPGKYETHVKPRLEEIEAWARNGFTQEEIAKKLGIVTSTFYDYKVQYSELREAIKNGERADDLVENTAFQMAVSGKFPIMTMWWLQNRRSNKWRNKQVEVQVSTEDTQVLTEYTKAIKEARKKPDKDDLNEII